MEASAADLQEGQRVIASFNQVEGRDVAVEIEAMGERPASSGTGSSGSASEPASPTDSSGR
jgi:hypothetical protein